MFILPSELQLLIIESLNVRDIFHLQLVSYNIQLRLFHYC